MMDKDEEAARLAEHERRLPPAAATLLPAPIASAISLATRSSALYLRLGTYIGSLALDGARVTTLTGLELSRVIIEGILHRAGRDVADRSKGALGRAEAEGLLERSIAALHSTITQISFAASTGFHLSSAALSSVADLSQHLLAALDAILGSTDSSRAIASIITLIRREFQNPATGKPGERVGVADLLIGICGLALLQRWCKNLSNPEARGGGPEDIVCWDVVILNDGRRADVIGATGDHEALSSNVCTNTAGGTTDCVPVLSTSDKDEILETIQRQTDSEDDQGQEWLESDLRKHIMSNLPPDASVSITTETTTTKIITVEITGAQPPDIQPPPGVEIVEENAHHIGTVDAEGEVLTNEQKLGLLIPKYRVVYRTRRNELRSSGITSDGPGLHQSDHAITDLSSERAPKKSARAIEASHNSPGAKSTVYGATPNFTPISPLEPDCLSNRRLTNPSAGPRDGEHSQARSPTGPETFSSQATNQKRMKRYGSSLSSISGSDNPPPRTNAVGKLSLSKKAKPETDTRKLTEKKSSLQSAFRKSSKAAISSIWNKDQSVQVSQSTINPKLGQKKPPWGLSSPARNRSGPSQHSIPRRGNSAIRTAGASPAPRRDNLNHFSSRDLGLPSPKELPRSASCASYYSVHTRRDSMVSLTDTFSIHSGENRSPSPTTSRTQLKAQSSIIRTRSEKDVTVISSSPQKGHRKAKSYVPSIYTLNTNNSETSLVLAVSPFKTALEDTGSLRTFIRTGNIDGIFPRHHIVRNMARFVRFASASYGASFMRVMGITTASEAPTRGTNTEHHYEHHSFSRHTQLPPSTILLSSFIDPQGGTDSTGETNTGVPMVHFISLDHDSRAVVLTCRGTLGFEDILTDMMCDYDDLTLRGKTYKVHKGIHASALRLLSGNGSRVLATLAAALEQFPDYGLVMCGHSLGGGVTALLAIMISEPGAANSSFVTSADYQHPQLLPGAKSNPSTEPQPHIRLPPGRPVHVYAYGPPATISPSLRLATRGLITTIVNGQDLVPQLSLGVLHDLQAVALAFKTDDSGAKSEFRSRVWAGITSGIADKWYGNRVATSVGCGMEGNDQWAYVALKSLRASMLSAKLVPPGEIFVVETVPVLQRDAFTPESSCRDGGGDGAGRMGLGKLATRAVLTYIRDVERRFGELRFGGNMLLDHSPGRYEASLAALGKGVLGS